MAISALSICKERCRPPVVLIVVMSAVLIMIIVATLVIEKGPIHKKYLTHIVSVMTPEEQRLLILRAQQNCYRSAIKLRQESSNSTIGQSMCSIMWDGLLCWDRTMAGTIVRKRCPDYINGFNTNEYATKRCTEDGTWWVNTDPSVNGTWTNFSECSKPAIDLSFHTAHGDQLRLLYTIGYSFSLGALLVAVIIMLCCKRLHSKSNTLHVNLFLAFILRAAVSFLKDFLFVGNVGLAKDVQVGKDGILEFVHDDTHWECKLLIVIFMYCVNACNMWIFAEALYLTMLVSRPLATERGGVRLYIILGWSLSFAIIIPWIIVKALFENTFCWNIQHNPNFYWILRGSGVTVVMINFCLFLNIFRKLFLKIRNSSQLGACGKAKYRKLAKFILVLIPLFGVMYIVFYIAVPSNFEETGFNVAYLYLEMGYNSFQGFVLALLFCFLNEEVHGELQRLWQRHRSRRHEMGTIRSSYFHSPSRRNHSSISKHDLNGHKKTSQDPSSRLQRNELHHLRTFSVSSEKSYDTSSVTNNTCGNHETISKQTASNESDVTVTGIDCDINSGYSQFTDVDHPDSFLKKAVWINAHEKLKRQRSAKTDVSESISLGWGEQVDNPSLDDRCKCVGSKI